MTDAVESNTNTEAVEPAAEGQGSIAGGDVEAKATTEKAEEQPIEYGEFTLPEGELDKQMLDEFVPLFKEARLPQEAAQALVNKYAESLPRIVEQVREQVTSELQKEVEADFKKRSDDYLAATRKDAEIGGTKLSESTAYCARAIDAFCSSPQEAKAFREAMNQMGMGNHPEIVRFLSRVGKAVSEDAFHRGSEASAPKDVASILFPEQAK